jgi:hypothetical protein
MVIDPTFPGAVTRRRQIAAACRILWRPDDRNRFTYAALEARRRPLGASIIEDQHRKAQEERHVPWRPPSLAQPFREWIEAVVTERFQVRNSITDTELLDLLEYHHSIAISADTLRHRINAIDSLKTVIGTPMEAE